MMIRCPGCGGRNPREALSCEWCHRSFIPIRQRGRSARWWGALSGVVIGVLLLFVGSLALLNAMRSTGRAAVAAPTPSPPPLPPLQVSSPVPSPAGPAQPKPAPTSTAESATVSPSPAARYARIAGTGGLGVNLRREPASTSATVAALPESAVVGLLGPEQRGSDGRVWRQVEDGQGDQGWVPADFLVETAGPPGR
jgi:hypothetical protein